MTDLQNWGSELVGLTLWDRWGCWWEKIQDTNCYKVRIQEGHLVGLGQGLGHCSEWGVLQSQRIPGTSCERKSNMRMPTWKKEKRKTWGLWVKFYLGQNADYNPGGESISDSSETLLGRGRGSCQYYIGFWWRGYMHSSTNFGRSLLLVMRSSVTINDFSAFLNKGR